jgi:integrase
MPKLTKRVVDDTDPVLGRDVFAWDSELRGFGLRVKATGVKSYLVQYRTGDGSTRRLVLGKHGVLTPEQARRIAVQKLAAAAKGEDPSAERHAARAGMTVTEVCDWYLEQAKAGRILGRNRRPIKASTLEMDESRIRTHIKPLIGPIRVRSLSSADIARLQADITAGKTAKARVGRGRSTRGGTGAAGRTLSTLRSLLGHARRWELIAANPAMGVRQVASGRRTRRLSREELVELGRAMKRCAAAGEHPTGLAAIRMILLSGFRRMEALALELDWCEPNCVRFPDTKSGPQVRVIGKTAGAFIRAQRARTNGIYAFPGDRENERHFIGVTRVLGRVCSEARLAGVTPHVLRHTFASIAAELGYSELTIAGLLGHAANGVTQRYVHLDSALVTAADHVSREIAQLIDGRKARVVRRAA